MISEAEARPIVVTQTYPVPPEVLWQAITDPQQMPQWFFDTIEAFEPRVGFETVFVVVADGDAYTHRWTVTEVVPREKIVYRWRYDGIPGDSTVTWQLAPTAQGTRLTLTHAGGETFPQDNPVFFRETGVEGWTYFLQDSLKSFLAEHAS